MDASKVKNAPPVQSVLPPKRTTEEASQVAARESNASAPQKPPYPAPTQTTNSQGQAIGTRINFSA